MNREDGLCLSWSWKPLIHSLKWHRKHLIQHCQSKPGHWATIMSLPGHHLALASSVFTLYDLSCYFVHCLPLPCRPYHVHPHFPYKQNLIHCPDGGGSMDLWNVGKLPPDYTILQPKIQQSSQWFLLLPLCSHWLWDPTVS
jgi:hypothetical protein